MKEQRLLKRGEPVPAVPVASSGSTTATIVVTFATSATATFSYSANSEIRKKGSFAMVKKAILLMLIVKALSFLSVTLVAASEDEDKDYWYSQAKDQMEELLSARKASEGHAKNVILFVGDGMGLSTVTAGRILKGQRLGGRGEGYRLAFEKFPFIALAKTYTIDSQIGDSSACATALMCGVKANINTVGLDHRGRFEDCRSSYASGVSSIIDWAQKHGKSTGIVTNTRLTHGTPSALYAKTPSRYWEDDTKVPPRFHAACKDIARQLVENQPGRNINVLLGGGRRHWFPYTEFDREDVDQRGRRGDGRNLLDDWVHDKKARDLNAEYVWNKAQFETVDPRYTDYLLGMFGYSHMDFEADRNKGPDGDPSLAEMTSKAIEILRNNPQGFFLMVEAGRIDHAHHHNNARRALEEVDVLDEAVRVALNLTDIKDTLTIVTADHSHVFTFGGDDTPRGHPLTALDVELSDIDGKPYTLFLYGNGPGYAHSTPTGRQDLTGFNTQDINFVQQSAVPKKYETHGGEDVPVYAQGPGSYLFSGTIEQSYIAHAIAHASCISKDNSHCEKPVEKEDECANRPVSNHNEKQMSKHHSNHDPVVMHVPDHSLEHISGFQDSIPPYEPFPAHDPLMDEYDPYSDHDPGPVHEQDSVHDHVVIHDHSDDHGHRTLFDSYAANDPAPDHDLASEYGSYSRGDSYQHPDSYAVPDLYAKSHPYDKNTDPYDISNPHSVSNPIPIYDPFSPVDPLPSQERGDDHVMPSIHDLYPDHPNPYPVQNAIPNKPSNLAPAPTSKPFGHTTPATEDQRRSRHPWLWSAGTTLFQLWSFSGCQAFSWLLIVSIRLIQL